MLNYFLNKLEIELKHIVMVSIIMPEQRNFFHLSFMSFGLNGKIGQFKTL